VKVWSVVRPPIDESRWPLAVVQWSGNVEDEALSAFLVQMDAWLARGERFGLLIDSSSAAGFSPEQRGRVIAHMKRHAASTSKLLIQAIVLQSLMQRTLFYGINLIFPNPFPSKVFADVASAEKWLLSMLASVDSTGPA
jgi:hypothetical protein